VVYSSLVVGAEDAGGRWRSENTSLLLPKNRSRWWERFLLNCGGEDPVKSERECQQMKRTKSQNWDCLIAGAACENKGQLQCNIEQQRHIQG